MADVAVVGAGIVGCAVAAFLAEAGADVIVLEREAIGAGASGRNSGVLQHPMDAALAPLFEESLSHYRGLGIAGAPHGVLVLAEEGVDLGHGTEGFPELRRELLAAGEPARLEPAIAPDVAGVRLDTGHPVGPTAATHAFADRARAAGARIVTGRDARLAEGGVVAGGERHPADAVVVAAGPWTPRIVDPRGAWIPIAPLWGVVCEVRLARPPRHVLEESGVDRLVDPGGEPQPLFTLVSTSGSSSLGSTFALEEPDAEAVAPLIRARGARFVPAIAAAPVASVRACARPLSADGLPLLGRAPGRDDLFVAAGHGPWGISLGPASGRLVADLVLGRPDGPPQAFDPARFGAGG